MSDVFRLELPTPFPVGPANAWWLDGPEPVLIDTGVQTPSSVSALEEQLAAHHRSLRDLKRILLTHDHYDHAGATAELVRRSGAQVYLHTRGRLGARWRPEELAELARFLARCGLPADVLSRAGESFRRGARSLGPPPPDASLVRLQGGERLPSPLGSLEVLATPGHSPDHLCYLAGEAGQLFCGDTLLADITPNPILHLDPQAGYRRSPSLLEYLASLESLAARPVRLAHPGHGPDLTNVAGLVASNQAFVRARQADFLAAVERGATTPYALAREVFGDQDVVGQFLALSETVAYLDLLERDAGLEVEWWRDPIRLQPAR
jgi:glyoxylase-like metal-dependent hydrolase (beta-lactamase superfamily II)